MKNDEKTESICDFKKLKTKEKKQVVFIILSMS